MWRTAGGWVTDSGRAGIGTALYSIVVSEGHWTGIWKEPTANLLQLSVYPARHSAGVPIILLLSPNQQAEDVLWCAGQDYFVKCGRIRLQL